MYRDYPLIVFSYDNYNKTFAYNELLKLNVVLSILL